MGESLVRSFFISLYLMLSCPTALTCSPSTTSFNLCCSFRKSSHSFFKCPMFVCSWELWKDTLGWTQHNNGVKRFIRSSTSPRVWTRLMQGEEVRCHVWSYLSVPTRFNPRVANPDLPDQRPCLFSNHLLQLLIGWTDVIQVISSEVREVWETSSTVAVEEKGRAPL